MASDTNTRRTRSGRVLARSDSPHINKTERSRSRVGKSPRSRRSRAGKTSIVAATPKLDGPLSELTKDMTEVPLRDIEAFVNRPASERRRETEGRNGYVTRPMNSFMLYRSAYADRTKVYCTQSNHQIVSAVSGESWRLEPPEVHERFNTYARIERENHAKAHPSYKFSPSKTGPTAARKKRGGLSSDDEEEEEPSDLEQDWEWKPAGERRSTSRSARQSQELQQQTQQPPQPPLQQQYRQQPYMSPNLPQPAHFSSMETYPRITWDEARTAKPLPSAMGTPTSYPPYLYQHPGQHQQHYQQQHEQQQQHQREEQQHYMPQPHEQTPQYTPEMYTHEPTYDTGDVLYYPYMSPPAPELAHASLFEQQIDPMLLQFDPHYAGDTNADVDAVAFADPLLMYGASFEEMQHPSQFEEWMQ